MFRIEYEVKSSLTANAKMTAVNRPDAARAEQFVRGLAVGRPDRKVRVDHPNGWIEGTASHVLGVLERINREETGRESLV